MLEKWFLTISKFSMKVIILAAGMGKRMGGLTRKIPKCFLKINGQPIILRLINQLRSLGIKDISIVTGYKSHMFKFKNVNLFYNKNYKLTNMVYSLTKAKKKLKDDTLIIYSDIILSKKILERMVNIKSKKYLSVAIDKNWKRYWAYRFDREDQDLESLRLNKKNILEIGKKVISSKNIDGRFIGIMRFPKKINQIFLNIWKKTANKNKLNWGISGKSLNKAYMTDLINKLIEKNVKCNAVLFNNGWYEFDNKKDFKKFNNYKFLN